MIFAVCRKDRRGSQLSIRFFYGLSTVPPFLYTLEKEETMKPAKGNPANLYYTVIATPLGKMIAASYKDRLSHLGFIDRKKPETALKPLATRHKAVIKKGNPPVLARTRKQLNLYFKGKLKKFNLRTNAEGTDFQKNVWKQLARIPLGRTVNYGKIAERAGRPKGARAAGMAVGSNPISVVVPCHRVIGKTGALTGFGGGIWRKKWLLKHEGALK
jgi:O-6-methylguanine DNA methyltransferase